MLIQFLMVCPVSDAASNFTAIRASFTKDLNLIENDHRYVIPIFVHRGMDPRRIDSTGRRADSGQNGRA